MHLFCTDARLGLKMRYRHVSMEKIAPSARLGETDPHCELCICET
jgi:hypothetical protein